ncbi:hypothetical protein HYN49_13515 [Flavobacterium pallidum]|uniref:RiboL-PSP-HEPN domain-containing protein n=1 Tax=Flavobacterium pallidum TaxID=2172098 RepID=A0A2S1SK87_9FLAO|nr:hypothetical protein HYN49_13515 [Flavobacterium pallidum]
MNENQVLYLFSSASQVIAAIYGLIITGYIFLRNELDRKADKDDSFEEIVELLKSEYFGSIINISVTTIFGISACFLVIVDEIQNNFILTILINISVATIITVLLLVIFFVIKILNPNSLKIASNRLRNFTANDSSNERGSLENFLTSYNEIEYILEKYGTAFSKNDNSDFQYQNRRKIAKTKLVYILFNEEKITSSLKDNLIKLITLRNGLIHGTNLFVSTNDVLFSQIVLEDLKSALGIL